MLLRKPPSRRCSVPSSRRRHNVAPLALRFWLELAKREGSNKKVWTFQTSHGHTAKESTLLTRTDWCSRCSNAVESMDLHWGLPSSNSLYKPNNTPSTMVKQKYSRVHLNGQMQMTVKVKNVNMLLRLQAIMQLASESVSSWSLGQCEHKPRHPDHWYEQSCESPLTCMNNHGTS